MNEYRVRCVLGPVSVELRTNDPAVIEYLGRFYAVAASTGAAAGQGSWVVDARTGDRGSMPRNAWGVAYAADVRARRLMLRAEDAANLAITTRKAIREVLVDFCERRRYTMLHASAFASAERVVIVVGDKGTGKTTLALRATLEHGVRYLSNDHLIVYADEAARADRLVLTSLPTPVPVKVGTYLDLEHLLPEPWDSEGLDIAAFRAMPRAERYRYDRRLLFTFRLLGQDHPVTVDLGDAAGGLDVSVVLASYAPADQVIGAPTSVADPVEMLMPHVRTDWMFNPELNQRVLPRSERDRATYNADARRLVTALAARARVRRWLHHGDPAPLLTGASGRQP